MSLALLIAAFVVATSGCLLLALSQQRHWHAAAGTSSDAPEWLRAFGWTLSALSLGVVILRDGFGFGVLLWPLSMGVAALVTTAILSSNPAVLRPLTKRLTNRRR